MNEEKKLVPKLRFPEFEVGSGWERRKIGEMLTETPRPIDLEDETDYCLVTVKRRYGGLVSRGVLKGKEIKVSSQFLVKAGDFVVSKRQIVHEACGLVPHDLEGCVVSNEYSVLTAKIGCNIDFFNRFAQQPCVSASFLECSVGIVIEKMLFKLPLWLRREFLFPAIAEQKKIADCLSSLDELIAAQARKVDALRTHKKGLMQQLFPREGETQPRLRFPEFQSAAAWHSTKLGRLGESLNNRRIPITSSDREPGNIPYYGASGIVDYVKDFIFDEDLLCISEDGANLVARTYPIAFPISGKTWVNNHAHVLKFEQACTQKFVEVYLNSIKLDDFITGMAQPKLNKAMLDSIPIPHPGVPEQQRIADCLTSLDNIITAATQELDTLKTHKKGLMQQLFPSAQAVEA